MIDKKNVIKRYLQEVDRVSVVEDETALKIAQIAARFNIPFFENKALRTRLLCCDSVYELSQNKRHEIVTLLKFFVNTQKKAQLSK